MRRGAPNRRFPAKKRSHSLTVTPPPMSSSKNNSLSDPRVWTSSAGHSVPNAKTRFIFFLSGRCRDRRRILPGGSGVTGRHRGTGDTAGGPRGDLHRGLTIQLSRPCGNHHEPTLPSALCLRAISYVHRSFTASCQFYFFFLFS